MHGELFMMLASLPSARLISMCVFVHKRLFPKVLRSYYSGSEEILPAMVRRLLACCPRTRSGRGCQRLLLLAAKLLSPVLGSAQRAS